jgi:hypothetical protein
MAEPSGSTQSARGRSIATPGLDDATDERLRGMVMTFDTSRAPMRADEFERLVWAVENAQTGDEGLWIEWKGSLDLRSPEGKAAVARCIVGMANRMPDAAARFCEGRGYMVIGVEPGTIGGVPEEDPADLSQWWTPYLGIEGPRWATHWVPVQGRTVLVIEVAAPRNGDPMFAIRRETTGIRDGDVFVRRLGKTDRASSAELTALVDRAAGAALLAGLAVSIAHPEAIRPVDFGPDALEQWVAAAREEALASLRMAQEPPAGEPARVLRTSLAGNPRRTSIAELKRLEEREAAGEGLTPDEAERLQRAREQLRQTMGLASQAIASQLNKFWSVEPESRTPEEYEEAVKAYTDEFRKALPADVRAGASHLLMPCTLALRNETPRNLPEVRLVVHIPGEETAATRSKRSRPEMPSPPRPFGPRSIDRFGLGAGYGLPNLYRPLGSFPGRPSGVHIDNGGSATLNFDPVHLRPHETIELPPVVLLLPPGEPVTATWEATSTGTDGVLRGMLTLPVAGDPLTVEEALRPREGDEDD